MHIIGQSRIDTWQTAKQPLESNMARLIHRPVRIQGKTRIDTWQTTGLHRRAHSALEVHRTLFSRHILIDSY
jgi:hypothetical protein